MGSYVGEAEWEGDQWRGVRFCCLLSICSRMLLIKFLDCSVVQRQQYLMQRQHMSEAAAYDQARKELYRFRHAREIEVRVAREEALNTGAYFGLGPLQVGMKIEDQMYEDWKAWAQKEIASQKALSGSAYTGMEEDGALDVEGPEGSALDEVAGSIPGTRGGQTALGGAAVHP